MGLQFGARLQQRWHERGSSSSDGYLDRHHPKRRGSICFVAVGMAVARAHPSAVHPVATAEYSR